MKILFVSREFPPDTGGGGIGSYVASMAPALVAAGHEVHVLSCAPKQVKRDVVVDGVVIHRRPTVRLRGTRRVFGKPAALRLEAVVSVLIQYRRLGRFDVVEVPDWLGEGWLLSRFLSVPTVAHLHTPLRLTQEFLQRPWTRSDRLADRVERAAVHRSTLTTAPSNLIVTALRERGWLDEREVEVIPLPVDWGRWAAVKDVQDTSPVVAVVGRVERRKGQLELVDAIARTGVTDAILMVVGWAHDSQYKAEIQERAAHAGVEVKWMDQVARDELPAVIAEARVVAVPSSFDNFPMAAMEAMAAGRPVVLSDMVGVAELLDGTGAGSVAPFGDAEAWAVALRPYLVDAAAAAAGGRAAMALVRERANPTVIVEKRLACYARARRMSGATE